MKNSKIKTLVVGLDFSRYSKSVARQAQLLASKLNLPLIYVHVFEQPYVSETVLATVIVQYMAFYEKKIRTHYRLPKNAKVIVECGQAYNHLIKISKKFPGPLIMVGYRGNTGPVKRFFIGSTAERLALHSSSPVWIHRGVKAVFPKNILIPSDLTTRTRSTIQAIETMGFQKKLRLELLHVLQPPLPVLDYEAWTTDFEKIKEHDTKRLQSFKKKFKNLKVVKSDGDIGDEIEKLGRKFDLIAITPREHKGALSSFGSVTSKIVKQGDTSVLVVP